MIDDWATVVGPKYMSLKGWFWHLPYMSPTYEFMACYVAFGILALDDARDIIDAAW